MKLKTLKDLTLTKVAKEELKTEAIKWVKFYEGWSEKEVDWKAVFIKVNNIQEKDIK